LAIIPQCTTVSEWKLIHRFTVFDHIITPQSINTAYYFKMMSRLADILEFLVSLWIYFI